MRLPRREAVLEAGVRQRVAERRRLGPGRGGIGRRLRRGRRSLGRRERGVVGVERGGRAAGGGAQHEAQPRAARLLRRSQRAGRDCLEARASALDGGRVRRRQLRAPAVLRGVPRHPHPRRPAARAQPRAGLVPRAALDAQRLVQPRRRPPARGQRGVARLAVRGGAQVAAVRLPRREAVLEAGVRQRVAERRRRLGLGGGGGGRRLGRRLRRGRRGLGRRERGVVGVERGGRAAGGGAQHEAQPRAARLLRRSQRAGRDRLEARAAALDGGRVGGIELAARTVVRGVPRHPHPRRPAARPQPRAGLVPRAALDAQRLVQPRRRPPARGQRGVAPALAVRGGAQVAAVRLPRREAVLEAGVRERVAERRRLGPSRRRAASPRASAPARAAGPRTARTRRRRRRARRARRRRAAARGAAARCAPRPARAAGRSRPPRSPRRRPRRRASRRYRAGCPNRPPRRTTRRAPTPTRRSPAAAPRPRTTRRPRRAAAGAATPWSARARTARRSARPRRPRRRASRRRAPPTPRGRPRSPRSPARRRAAASPRPRRARRPRCAAGAAPPRRRPTGRSARRWVRRSARAWVRASAADRGRAADRERSRCACLG